MSCVHIENNGWGNNDVVQDMPLNEGQSRFVFSSFLQDVISRRQQSMADIDLEFATLLMTFNDILPLLREEFQQLPSIRMCHHWQQYYRFRIKHPLLVVDRATFAQYWRSFSDAKTFNTIRPAQRTSYEQEVFFFIAQAIEDGSPPQLQPSPRFHRSEESIKEVAEKLPSLLAEAKQIFSDMAPILKELVGLLGKDRTGISPDRQAACAQVLLAKQAQFHKLARQL